MKAQYNYSKGGSMYPGRTFKSIGIRAYLEWCYEECVWRRRKDGEWYPSLKEWLGPEALEHYNAG